MQMAEFLYPQGRTPLLKVTASGEMDRHGIIRDTANTVEENRCDVIEADFKVSDDGTFDLRLLIDGHKLYLGHLHELANAGRLVAGGDRLVVPTNGMRPCADAGFVDADDRRGQLAAIGNAIAKGPANIDWLKARRIEEDAPFAGSRTRFHVEFHYSAVDPVAIDTAQLNVLDLRLDEDHFDPSDTIDVKDIRRPVIARLARRLRIAA